MNIPIYFEDQHVIVLSKPYGLLSQSDRSCQKSLVDYLRKHFERHYVGLVHRLDRTTSGLMVVAKRTKAAQRLTQQLHTGTLKRTYLTWLEGKITQTQCWEHYLNKNSSTNTSYASLIPPGKKAILQLEPLQHTYYKKKLFTLCQCQLKSGRSHQIRVQSSFENHPILGDEKYHGFAFQRIALHSYQLGFHHPMSSEPLFFEEGLPKELQLC